STAAIGILERLCETGYQFCLVDPEGDYEGFEHAVILGDGKRAPSVDEVLHLLKNPNESGVVNMLGIPLADRPSYFAGLLPRLQELRSQTGRPHWLVVDEAHHMLPSSWEPAPRTLPRELGPILLVTLHPSHISRDALSGVDVVLAVGDSPDETLREYAATIDVAPPELPVDEPGADEVLAWFRGRDDGAEIIHVTPGRGDRRRHRRKYAEGDVGPEKSFVFRGPEG